MNENEEPVESSALPYADRDCVAAFLEDMRTAPLFQCEHLAEFPHLIGAREMCAPNVVRCFACAALDLSDLAYACHCCGAQEPTTTLLLAASTTGVRCSASLCSLCVGLAPPKSGASSGLSDI
jgi:hypothetical protein